MRKCLKIACALVVLLIAGSAAAQETRGTPPVVIYKVQPGIGGIAMG
jgi:hypothetical protein